MSKCNLSNAEFQVSDQKMLDLFNHKHGNTPELKG